MFYLIGVFDHDRRRFHLRMEEERGDAGSGSVHTLSTYLLHMATVVRREAEKPEEERFWRYNLYRDMLRSSARLEQVIMASFDDSGDPKATRLASKPHRKAMKEVYKGLNYTPFGSPT